MADAEQKDHKRRPTKSRIPRFKSIEEEAEFCDTHSTSEFEDECEPVENVRFVVTRSQVQKPITVRLPEDILSALSNQAHEQGIGRSTLVRTWILERMRERR